MYKYTYIRAPPSRTVRRPPRSESQLAPRNTFRLGGGGGCFLFVFAKSTSNTRVRVRVTTVR